MKVHFAVVAALALFSVPSGAHAESASLIGNWSLISVKGYVKNGAKTFLPYGPKPTGFLTYTSDGRMWVILTNDGRRPLATGTFVSASIEERAAALSTLLSYTGGYTLTGDKVTHHIEASSFQNWVNTDQVRRVLKLEPNLLVFRAETPIDREGVHYDFQDFAWQRIH